MPLRLVIEPAADLDIDEQLSYLAGSSMEAALRFYQATKQAFQKIADMPGIGTLLETDTLSLFDVRRFPVPGFPKYLIFYRAAPEAFHVIRIIHGARDIRAILEPD